MLGTGMAEGLGDIGGWGAGAGLWKEKVQTAQLDILNCCEWELGGIGQI